MIKFCSLFSGSSGNAIYLEVENTKILIDSGVSGKKIQRELTGLDVCGSDIDAILVTHEHRDHVHGVGVMSRRYDIPVYANEDTWEGMKDIIGKVKEYNIKYFDVHKQFNIKDIGIKPFSIPHDAANPVGFNFFAENKKITLATDIGHITNEICESLKDSDMVLLESNHDVEMLKSGSYPYYLKRRILGEKGHLCNDDAGRLIASLAVKGTTRFLLGHLSKENNFPELAYQTVYNELTSSDVKVGKDVVLEVAQRNSRSSVFSL